MDADSKVDKLRERVSELARQGDEFLSKADAEDPDLGALNRRYERWFTEGQILVAANLRIRLEEFEGWYAGRNQFLLYGSVAQKRTLERAIQKQQGIIESIAIGIDARLLDLTALLTADLLGDELDQAREMHLAGHVRCAGVLAGVGLERHLKLLHQQAGLEYGPKDTAQPLADRLRKAGHISVGAVKQVTAMADVRHRCAHPREQEPTSEEVAELIEDVERFSKRTQL